MTTAAILPSFFGKVKAALEQSTPFDSLLASVPSAFPAEALGGHWVTAYRFRSGTAERHHADIAELTPKSDRRITAKNHRPEPRTQGHATGFRNEIEAELVNRHLIGHWKNISDRRYFGSFHLAVLPGENLMDGYYTSFSSDILVGTGHWRWVRLDPTSLLDLSQVVLREPQMIYELLNAHSEHAGPLALDKITGDV